MDPTNSQFCPFLKICKLSVTSQEAALSELRSEVCRTIRANFSLRRDLRSLEVKLGLVEEGRLSVAEVASFYQLATKRRDRRVINQVRRDIKVLPTPK